MYPSDVPVIDLAADTSGASRRMADRPLVVGIALSLTVHALIVAAVLLMARSEGPATARPDPSALDRSVEVALIPRADEATGPGKANPTPAVISAPAPGIGSTEPRPMATVPDPKAAGGAPTVQTAEGAAPVAAAQPVVFDPAAGDDYRHRLFEHIAAHRGTPAVNGERSAGTVMVRFSITRGGDVIAVSVASSSGAPNLDDEAVATVWRAGPMPSIPPTLPGRLSITLPVTFEPGVRTPG